MDDRTITSDTGLFTLPARRRVIAVLGVVLIAALVLLVTIWWPTHDTPPASELTAHPPSAWSITDEGLTVDVPEGLAAYGHPFALPPTITLHPGQRIIVRNHDSITHVVLGMAVKAGRSADRVLERPGLEIYSDGCAAHTVGIGMTTLIITEAAPTP